MSASADTRAATRAGVKVCIIGAGCSGLTTAKRLKEHGLAYDQFELSDDVGGNWYFRNPNGRSAVYESLHIDTSTTRLQFEEFPAPADWPHFPHHTLIHQYFRDYAEHFGLREGITFGTGVERAVPIEDDAGAVVGWDVTLTTGETRRYTDLVVANGHHWKPRLPDYPGADTFAGVLMHSHAYVNPFDPVEIRGKRVVVVGMGNSAMDIAGELSAPWMAERLYVSARRGVWVLPKYRNGQPADKVMAPPDVPKEQALVASRALIRELVGSMSSYGLPEPDHEPLSAHPSVSADFLTKAGSGDLTVVAAIERLEGSTVHLVDGTRLDDVDVVICATGYEISFPFFDDERTDLHPDAEHRYPLFKRVLKPGVDHLFFAGLAQSSPTIVNLAEQQSKLIAGILDGSYALPPVEEQERILRADEAAHLEQYYDAPRHTIQIDFGRYCVDLHAELEAGRARAAAG